MDLWIKRRQQMTSNQEDEQNQYNPDELPANNFRSTSNKLAKHCYRTLESNCYREAIHSAQPGRNLAPLK
jgi:hypothetical protein